MLDKKIPTITFPQKMLSVFEKLTVKPEKHYDGDTIELEFLL